MLMIANINKANARRIELLHDTETIIKTYLHILHNTNSRWDYFADARRCLKTHKASQGQPISRAFSDLCYAAIHEQFDTCDITAVIGCKEGDGFGDFIRSSHSPQRYGAH